MKVIVVNSIAGVFETVHKRLARELKQFEIGRRAENIKTTELLRLAVLLEKSPGDLR